MCTIGPKINIKKERAKFHHYYQHITSLAILFTGGSHLRQADCSHALTYSDHRSIPTSSMFVFELKSKPWLILILLLLTNQLKIILFGNAILHHLPDLWNEYNCEPRVNPRLVLVKGCGSGASSLNTLVAVDATTVLGLKEKVICAVT